MNPARYTQGGAFTCTACGASYLPNYPLPVGALIALARWWDETHKHCTTREARGTFTR